MKKHSFAKFAASFLLVLFTLGTIAACSPKGSPQLTGGCAGQKTNNHKAMRKFLY
jgi:hypothetical protein